MECEIFKGFWDHYIIKLTSNKLRFMAKKGIYQVREIKFTTESKEPCGWKRKGCKRVFL